MDKPFTVVFRNVGQLYFPQTRVECHYSMTPGHQWSSSDWIGIFEVGCSSVKDYYTYTWAVVPEGYAAGTAVDCCALFHACYLPRPSAMEYQFVYVDKMGEVCARSRPFTFCAPKPLDELETLKEEREQEDGEEELLLVIPRAQLLQSRLEECLKTQTQLQQHLHVAQKEADGERESSTQAKMEWESERRAMKEEIAELRDNLRQSCDKQRDVKYNQEGLTSELSKLVAEKSESQQRIRLLEDDVALLTDREKERSVEVDRMKERARKMSSQMKHDEEKRKSLQTENEAALAEVQRLQERLEAAELGAESLRRELRELGVHQGHAHAELHQARVQVAQLTLQLSEENLVLREERATWALEREAHKHAAEADKKKLQELSSELQRKEEWFHEERTEREKLETELARERDCNRELLSDAKRELQELNGNLRRARTSREEQQREREDLVNHVCRLEQRLGIVSETSSNGDVSPSASAAGSSSEDDEDGDGSSARPSAHLERLEIPADRGGNTSL